MAYRLSKILFSVAVLIDAQIFTNAVEYDDGVVDGCAEEREERNDE